MQELEDMMKDPKIEEEISDKAVRRANQERKIRDYFTQQIYNYCRINKISIGEMGVEEVEQLTDNLSPTNKQLFLEQFELALRTQRWKSLKRIEEHGKSLFLKQRQQW